MQRSKFSGYSYKIELQKHNNQTYLERIRLNGWCQAFLIIIGRAAVTHINVLLKVVGLSIQQYFEYMFFSDHSRSLPITFFSWATTKLISNPKVELNLIISFSFPKRATTKQFLQRGNNNYLYFYC